MRRCGEQDSQLTPLQLVSLNNTYKLTEKDGKMQENIMGYLLCIMLFKMGIILWCRH